MGILKRKPRRSREFKKNNQVIDIDEARRERREKRAMAIAEARAKEEERERQARLREESARQKRHKRRRKAVYFTIAALIVVVIGAQAYNILSLRHEKAQLEKEQALLIETRDKLIYQLENVNDPDYIEQMARTQLRLVKPGEVLYILPSTEKAFEEANGGADEDSKGGSGIHFSIPWNTDKQDKE